MNMKIGVAVPCSIKDLQYLPYCQNSIFHLDPAPYKVDVFVNNLGDLRKVRNTLFDRMFADGCDVVLMCDADFHLFPHILRDVRSDVVTSFAQLEKKVFSDWQQAIVRMLWRKNWSGLYSLPKQLYYDRIRDTWDGLDTSIHNLCRDKYVFIKKFSYFALRPTNTFSIQKRLLRKIRTILNPTGFQHSLVNEASILSKIGQRFQGSTVFLDLGCGVGRWGYLLKMDRRQIIGMDIHKPYLLQAKAHEDVVLGDAAYLPFKEKTFNVVVAVELIEHLHKDKGWLMLKEIKRVGKKVVLTTPKTWLPIYMGKNHPENHLSFWSSKEILMGLGIENQCAS